MGYDKPDLSFVIHYQTPGSVVAYYQQVGRAARALESAYGILLSGREESDITDWFIRSAFPTRDEVAAVLAALESAREGLSVPELLGIVNLSKGRIKKTIALPLVVDDAPAAPFHRDVASEKRTACPESDAKISAAATDVLTGKSYLSPLKKSELASELSTVETDTFDKTPAETLFEVAQNSIECLLSKPMKHVEVAQAL